VIQHTDSGRAARYNRAMSARRGRRIGIAALLVLLALGLVLALAPAAPGAVRFRGVSLLWWYSALVAPLTATALATLMLVRDAG
jgi:hypothetical protein